ncbi:MAG: branched-chain amino acid ABC transporter permease [Cellulomonadaceae bacterium]
MTAVLAAPPPRLGRVLPGALAILGVFLALFLTTGSGIARATTTDSPCDPSAGSACLLTGVRDASGAKLGGVTVSVAGPSFDEEFETVAGEDLSITLPGAGTYTVSFDPDTLPEGTTLPSGAATEKSASGQLGSSARVFFILEAGASTAPPTSGSETGEAGEAPAPDDATVDAEPTPSGSVTAKQFWQQLGSGLRFGLLLALAAVGLSLIYGTTKLSSFSHGEQVTLGAVSAYLFINVMGLPLAVGVVLTVLVCGATGWLQDAGIWKPLRRRGTPIVQMMIVTIGLSIALQFTIQLIIGPGSVRILTSNPQVWTVGPFTLTRASWVAMGIAIVVLAAVAWFLTKTRIGQATRAVSDNASLASATGIDTDKIVRIVWVLATALAGLGGMLYAMVFGTTNWMMGMQMLLLMFAAVTLGGLGTAFGALVGSIVIGLVVELSNLVLPSDLRYATALAILILVLLVRPQGLLGRRERIG